MKERPILFSAPMVNAILDGRKTQTRRVVKHKKQSFIEGWIFSHLYTEPCGLLQVAMRKCGLTYSFACPYGKVGDQLWVRESFNYSTDKELHPDEKPNPAPQRSNYLSKHLVYAADGVKSHPEFGKARWKPSIHMPRWASRIQLEITDIRVERLQDISDDDALEEGVDRTNTSIKGYARQRFQNLWQKINGVDSWDKNHWVWVIEFERIKP